MQPNKSFERTRKRAAHFKRYVSMKATLIKITSFIAILSFVNFSYCNELNIWETTDNQITHIETGFIFPKRISEFKYIKVSDNINPHSEKSSGISYEIPGKDVKALILIVPESVGKSKDLYLSFVNIAKSQDSNMSLKEITPPPFGRADSRHAAFIAKSKPYKHVQYIFQFLDRNHHVSITVVHKLDTNREWLTKQVFDLVIQLNWSNK